MLIKIVLGSLDAFRWLLRLMGIDYLQLRAIMEIKLVMDNRRPGNAMFRIVDKESDNVLLMTMGFFTIMGLIMGFVVTLTDSPFVAMTLFLTFIMTFITLTVIADYSSVLLDIADAPILQPRPLDGRTILASRLVHITIYLLLLTFSLAAGSIILGSVRFGLVTLPVMIISLILATLFVIVLVQVLYSLALRFLNAERLREIILIIQTLAVLVFVGGGVVLTRILESDVLRNITFENRWWVYLLPPSWFAAPVALAVGPVGPTQLILSCLAVVVPLLGILLVVRVLGPGFGSQLEKLEAEEGTSRLSRREKSASVNRMSGLAKWASGIALKTQGEKASFSLVWKLISHDRQYLLRTYPMLALLFFYLALFFIKSDQGPGEALGALTASNQHLIFLYIVAFVAPFFITNLRFSPVYEAAWVFRSLPFARPGEILLGGLKAVLLKYVIPVFMLVSVILVSLWGPRILMDIILAGCTGTFIMLLYANIFGRHYPFSEEYKVAKAAGRSSIFALLFFVPILVGITHAAARAVFPPGIIIGIPIFLAIDLGLARLYTDTPLRMVNR